jgi:dihydroorotate dehydrogenase (NAD+) catalytic subunit
VTGTLARTLLGITFQNPVLLASGTAAYGRELDGVMELERLGGLVTKAVSLEPRRGNPAPRVSEFPGGMINSVGLANPGLGAVRRHDLPWLATHLSRARVLVNVVGFREEEYAAVVSGLDDASGFVAWELNLSCPNTAKGGIEFGAEPDSVSRIVGSVRKVTRRPVFAKLSPVLPDIAAMACAARDAGADGVSLVNTMPGYLYNGDRPRVGQGNGGISGPALRPVGLLAVRRVAERTRGELPIIGVGGISTSEHVREYLRSGASLVAIGTAALADPRLPGRIVEDLTRDAGRETRHG